MSNNENESVKVLRECIDLQIRKGQDYQNPNSQVKQAMYYPRGISSIHDVVNAKKLRIDSLLESTANTNFESLEDSYKDLINYASFAVSWLRGEIDGQDKTKDMYNK
ncbi:MAG: hypothetical protein COA52_00575 [Hyphomicrobiales bacterium]|nr:MAG: hypothetical protein COA52_00575 [Hyphomicrobiales bacterium]